MKNTHFLLHIGAGKVKITMVSRLYNVRSEIADKMCVSPRTVDRYRDMLFEKLNE